MPEDLPQFGGVRDHLKFEDHHAFGTGSLERVIATRMDDEDITSLGGMARIVDINVGPATAYELEMRKRLKRGFVGMNQNIGFLYLLPWIIGFVAFKIYPFIASFIYSFTDLNLFRGAPKFIGLKNYLTIFTTEKYLQAFGVTFQFAFFTVPLKLAFALFIAYILNYRLKGIRLFRTAYYIPSILGGSVAISILWQFLWRNDGLINQIIGLFGGDKVNWLGDPRFALFVISLLRIWQFGSSMVIFLAALKGVPGELYEAASIDGASRWKQFFRITVPMITPIIFYNMVTQLVQAFQEFNGPYIITGGGPLGSTTVISLLIYQNAFRNYNLGLASAMSWLLFVIIAVFTLIAFNTQKYWVYYDTEVK